MVLVAEDEASIRALECRLLVESGYDVLEASNGEEALAFIKNGQPLVLVVVDLEMPLLSGDEMVSRIRALRPNLKVLFVTGMINRLLDARPLLRGEAFLEKPFSNAGFREASAAPGWIRRGPRATNGAFGANHENGHK